MKGQGTGGTEQRPHRLADNDPAQMFEYGDVKQYWGTSHVKQIGNFYQSLLGLAPMYVTAENAF